MLLNETLSIFNYLNIGFWILSLYLTYKVHNTSLLKHSKGKQLEEVNKVVQVLNKSKIHCTFCRQDETGGSRVTTDQIYNIFEIARLYEQPEIKGVYGVSIVREEFDEALVILNQSSEQIIEILEYIDHPLMPKKIANELASFYNSRVESESLQSLAIDFVLIETNLKNSSNNSTSINSNNVVKEFNKGDAISLKTWYNFKAHCFQLKAAIEDWYLKEGIESPNLREDLKNVKILDS